MPMKWFASSALPSRPAHPTKLSIVHISDSTVTPWSLTNGALTASRCATGVRVWFAISVTIRARLQETVAELEHFSYTITHDMRAPLRAMRGFADILLQRRSKLPADQQDFIRRIANSAERMDDLITDALNYSKVVREELDLEPVNPETLLRGISESYPQFQPPKALVEIRGKFPPVLANRAGLTQCFSNLLGNAVKFVAPGTVPRIRIWAKRQGRGPKPGTDVPFESGDANSRLVRIWFEDNGIGIARQYHEVIFKMFYRLSKSYEGTGIGLALVRKVVERMRGRVGIESEEGRGSRFWVELPECDVRKARIQATDGAAWGR